MSEDELLRAVLDLAKMYGWRTAHFRPAQSQKGHWLTAVQGDGVGYPDLTMVRRSRLIFAELKSKVGKETPAQTTWLDALRRAGAEVYVWRPADLERIAAALR